jgi:hypothetical protein
MCYSRKESFFAKERLQATNLYNFSEKTRKKMKKFKKMAYE